MVALCKGSPFGQFNWKCPVALEVSLVGLGGSGLDGANKHVVIGAEMRWVLNGDRSEEAATRPQDIVTL